MKTPLERKSWPYYPYAEHFAGSGPELVVSIGRLLELWHSQGKMQLLRTAAALISMPPNVTHTVPVCHQTSQTMPFSEKDISNGYIQMRKLECMLIITFSGIFFCLPLASLSNNLTNTILWRSSTMKTLWYIFIADFWLISEQHSHMLLTWAGVFLNA